jgi:hypothetical protein
MGLEELVLDVLEIRFDVRDVTPSPGHPRRGQLAARFQQTAGGVDRRQT